MQKSLPQQCNLRQLKTLDLSKNIIAGTTNLAMVEMGLTVKNTFESSNIRSVFKGEHGQIGFSVVNVLVKRFMDSFGFATKMNDIQIESLTVDTLEKFAFETLEDIILFFKMARTGSFGSTMRGVDSNLIFGEWFPLYLEFKAGEREKVYQKEKDSYRDGELTLEDVRKAYKSQMNSPQKIHAELVKSINELTEGFTRQQLEDLISEWEKDESKAKFISELKKKRLEIKGDFKL